MMIDYKNTPYIEDNTGSKYMVKIAIPIGVFF